MPHVNGQSITSIIESGLNDMNLRSKQRSLYAWLQEAHPDVFKQWECIYYVEQSVINEWEQ